MLPVGMREVITPDMTPQERKIALQESVMENRICSMVGQELERHYPDWPWYVECRLPTGLIAVKNMALNGDYGFYLPIAGLINETDPKLVMRAGGEVLERYRLDRGKMPELVDVERDFLGKAIGDTDATS